MTKIRSDKLKHIKTDKNEISNEDISELKRQAQEYLAGWQRAQADYQNLKKEMEIKMGAVNNFAKGALLIDFLPIYTNLLAAWEHIPEADKNKDWAIGFKHIKKQLEGFLANQGLEKIETHDKEFDHDIHDAVDTEWHEDKEEGIILQEISPGYRLDNNIFIHPKVVVNSQTKNLDDN